MKQYCRNHHLGNKAIGSFISSIDLVLQFTNSRSEKVLIDNLGIMYSECERFENWDFRLSYGFNFQLGPRYYDTVDSELDTTVKIKVVHDSNL